MLKRPLFAYPPPPIFLFVCVCVCLFLLLMLQLFVLYITGYCIISVLLLFDVMEYNKFIFPVASMHVSFSYVLSASHFLSVRSPTAVTPCDLNWSLLLVHMSILSTHSKFYHHGSHGRCGVCQHVSLWIVMLRCSEVSTTLISMTTEVYSMTIKHKGWGQLRLLWRLSVFYIACLTSQESRAKQDNEERAGDRKHITTPSALASLLLETGKLLKWSFP